MRLLVDTLIAGMLLVALAAILFMQWQDRHQDEQVRAVQQSLLRFREVIDYHTALGEVPLNSHRHPATVSPLWFRDGLPSNAAAPGRQPWLDVAPEGDLSDNPPDPVIRGPEQAAYWYSPSRGIVRARVAPQFTERATVERYNQVNGTYLGRLAPLAERAARAPQPILNPETLALATLPPQGQPRATLRSDGLTPAASAAPAPVPAGGPHAKN